MTDNAIIWLPLAGLIWAFFVLWYGAGVGRLKSSVFSSWLGVLLSPLYFYAIYALSDSGSNVTWQYVVLIGWYVFGLGACIQNIARGGKVEDWSGSEAFIGTLMIAGVAALWITGATV